jgi:hypothetical protein
MQADFVLYLRGCQLAKEGVEQQWFPDTLLYSHDYDGPFEIFVRSQSNAFFRQIIDVLGVGSKIELEALVKALRRDGVPFLASWDFHTVPVRGLLGLEQIGTKS